MNTGGGGSGKKKSKKELGALDLTASAKRTPKLHRYQAYIKMDRDRVLGIIRERYAMHKEEANAGGVSPEPWLKYMADQATKMLEEEPQQLQTEVEEFRKKNPDPHGVDMFMETDADAKDQTLQARAVTVQQYVNAVIGTSR